MSSQPTPKVLSQVQNWLNANHQKIQNFWIGADWRVWARFELYIILEQAFSSDYVVFHSINLWEGQPDEEQVDIVLEPRESKIRPLAIRLRCENVNENCGSFERFSEQYQRDWKKLEELREKVDGSYEGVKILLLGISGETMAADGDDPPFGELEPDMFRAGEVYSWHLCYDTQGSG